MHVFFLSDNHIQPETRSQKRISGLDMICVTCENMWKQHHLTSIESPSQKIRQKYVTNTIPSCVPKNSHARVHICFKFVDIHVLANILYVKSAEIYGKNKEVIQLWGIQ